MVLAMSKQRRPCVYNPDLFCYICGDCILKRSQSQVTEFVQKACLAYFGISIRDRCKSCVPYIVCKGCLECLRRRTKKSNVQMKFGSPMMWSEPKNHQDDCYFCSIEIGPLGTATKVRSTSLSYLNVSSMSRPLLHSDELPVSVSTHLPQVTA